MPGASWVREPPLSFNCLSMIDLHIEGRYETDSCYAKRASVVKHKKGLETVTKNVLTKE